MIPLILVVVSTLMVERVLERAAGLWGDSGVIGLFMRWLPLYQLLY